MKTTMVLRSALAWITIGCAVATAETPIAPHPSKIAFPTLNYELPPASQFRSVLSNGLVVYIAEDRMLPTFDLSITLRVGGAIDPPGHHRQGKFRMKGQVRNGSHRGIKRSSAP